MWRDQIMLFGHGEDDESVSPAHPDLAALTRKVQIGWPRDGWVDYVEVADSLGEVPWDVLDACRLLARAGVLIERRGEQRTHFRRA